MLFDIFAFSTRRLSVDALLYVLTFAFLAAPVYFIDRRFGSPAYRWGYNLWHKEPLPDGVERGFIVGRKAKERILPSVALTILFCFFLSYYIHDPVELVMKSPLIFVGLTVGFLLTGFAMREGKKPNAVVDKVCKVMDDIEEGKVDLTGAASSALRSGVVQAKDALSHVADDAAETVAALRAVKPEVTLPVEQVAEDALPEETSTTPPAPKRSLNDALEAFRNRR